MKNLHWPWACRRETCCRHDRPPGPRKLRPRALAVLLLMLAGWLVGVIGFGTSSAVAASPVDHRSTASTSPVEMAGAGYLLSDPLQGPNATNWVGAYRTIAGAKAYCVDRLYDYPDPRYGYRTAEVSSWPGRNASNNGANGHQAQRIIWIVNTYGQAPSAATNAAVSVAINLLNGSAPFQRSYDRAFKQQLTAINPAIVTAITAMLQDSDRFAGPYTTRVTFGPAPALGAVGQFAVSVRSARDFPVRNAGFRVTSVKGGRLTGATKGVTGPSGVVRVPYLATAAGTVTATATGTAPNTTMRLGFSPTHNTQNFRTGSQRVALASRTPLATVGPGTGHVAVTPPVVRTQVVDGNGTRPAGEKVSDQLTASGLVPNGRYVIEVTLSAAPADSPSRTGEICGTASVAVVANAMGELSSQTPPIAVCGRGVNTFSEQVKDSTGRVVAVSPPGLPSETFPVTVPPPAPVVVVPPPPVPGVPTLTPPPAQPRPAPRPPARPRPVAVIAVPVSSSLPVSAIPELAKTGASIGWGLAVGAMLLGLGCGLLKITKGQRMINEP